MKTKISKAMVLAAGFGTRLRPLTNSVPKPLLSMNEKRLIDFPLNLLSKHGITEVIINIHHLGQMIEDYIEDGRKYGLKVSYSKEEKILGTGGGIKNAEGFFKKEPFVCINSDALVNVDLSEVVKKYFDSGCSSLMVVKQFGKDDDYGKIDVDENGYIKSIGNVGSFFYTGVQVVGKSLLDALPPKGIESCLIEDGYKKLIAKGERVFTYLYDGYFNDVGTPERYEKAKKDMGSWK